MPEPTTPREQFSRERERVVDLLRSMPATRLARTWGATGPVPDDDAMGAPGSVADAAHGAAQWCADAEAVISGSPPHVVPRLGDLAAGDQLAVTSGDLLAADPPDVVLAEAAARLAELRRRA